LESAALASKITQLGEAFVDSSGRYQPGSLLNAIANLPEGDPLFGDALNAAEQVLPTRWRNNPARLQAFYTLWEHAEAAKIKLGARREPGAEPAAFELGEQEVGTLLGQCGIAHTFKEPGTLGVPRDAGRFERAAARVTEEAVGTARGLLAGRLPRPEAAAPGPDAAALEEAAQEPLDWLILSGKTCNLNLVHRLIRQEFV